jgi:hypothetical protein
MSDTAIGRWHCVDPLAEDPTQIMFSPYHYVGNNPLVYLDPDGLKKLKFCGTITLSTGKLGFNVEVFGLPIAVNFDFGSVGIELSLSVELDDETGNVTFEAKHEKTETESGGYELGIGYLGCEEKSERRTN